LKFEYQRIQYNETLHFHSDLETKNAQAHIHTETLSLSFQMSNTNLAHSFALWPCVMLN